MINIILAVLFVIVNEFYGLNLVMVFEEERLKKLAENELPKIRVYRKRLVQCLGFVFFIGNSKVKIFISVIGYFLYKRDYFRMIKKERELKEAIHYAFPIWIRTIQCLLQNNTVVSAVSLSLKFVPEVLRNDLEYLVVRLEAAPESLSSYEEFMSEHKNIEIQKMMKHLYRYSRSGSKDSADAMFRMVDHASIWMGDVRTEKQSAIISSFSWLGIIPVASVSIFFVLIMFFVMVQMFEGGWV